MPTHEFFGASWPKNKKPSVMHVHFAGISPLVSFNFFFIKYQLHECLSTRDDYCVLHLLKLMMQGISKAQTLSLFSKSQS